MRDIQENKIYRYFLLILKNKSIINKHYFDTVIRYYKFIIS